MYRQASNDVLPTCIGSRLPALADRWRPDLGLVARNRPAFIARSVAVLHGLLADTSAGGGAKPGPKTELNKVSRSDGWSPP